MKHKHRSSVPRSAGQIKKIPDDTIYLTPNGYRVRIDSEIDDPIIGTKVREVSNGKWWYIKRDKLTKL